MSKPHAFVPWKFGGKPKCKYCGLVRLNNWLSQQAASSPCRWWED